MILSLSGISVALLVLVSFDLYYGVHRVKAQEQTLASLKAQIAREAEAIRVLKAEWTYLNQPERLQALARRHLAMAQTGASQIVVLSLRCRCEAKRCRRRRPSSRRRTWRNVSSATCRCRARSPT